MGRCGYEVEPSWRGGVTVHPNGNLSCACICIMVLFLGSAVANKARQKERTSKVTAGLDLGANLSTTS